MIKKFLVVCIPAILFISISGCVFKTPGEKGTEIILSEDVMGYVDEGAILVDARKLFDYQEGHAQGAVNIPRADIVVNQPRNFKW